MRRRLWWDLVDSDMFQSACLDRPPLIRLSSREVPLPLNCNDSDLTDSAIRSRPIEEPTEMSMNIFRATLFRMLNHDYFQREADSSSSEHEGSADDVARDRSWKRENAYKNVVALDEKVLNLMAGLPWYFQLDDEGRPPRLPEPLGERLVWQQYILRTCVNTQRVRMYRQFLHPRTGMAWENCVSAVQDSMLAYRSLPLQITQSSRQKFLPQAYQVFSVAVTAVALLLVEGSLPIPDVYQQIRNMAKDLGMLERQGCRVPIAIHGRRVLRKMLELCEARATTMTSTSPEEAQTLVPDISIILGGERVTRAYMNRLQEPSPPEGAAVCAIPSQAIGAVLETWEPDEVAYQEANPPRAGHEQSSDVGSLTRADFRPDQTTESWHLLDGVGPEAMEGDLDPALFVQDASLMGLLNWDMTGLLMLDPSEL